MVEITSNAANGTPNWVDIGVPDLTRAKEFYTALLGWEYLDGGPDTGGYNLATKKGKPVAGVMQNPEPDATEFWWGLYFSTDDSDGTAKRITDAGGTIVLGPDDVMDLGRLTIAKDPQGAQFGLWEGRNHIGAQLVNEPGGFTWNELVVPETGPSAAFYAAVLGQPVEPMGVEGFDYATINVDGRPVAGIYGDPQGGAPRWVTYFAVDDADEAARTVVAQGGTVVSEPKDSPYGRFAVVRDPFGAEFAVMKVAENPSS